MSLFARVPLIPPDPIFGLNTAFFNDPRPQKVNLGVGSYKDRHLNAFILPSVKQAEEIIYQKETHKEYLPIDGDRDFIELVSTVFFHNKNTLYGVQTIGGTGALKIGAEFLRRYIAKKVYISDPTWDNHRRLFLKAGYSVSSYQYYNRTTHSYDHAKCMNDIAKMEYGTVILLHGACHNPTGCDPTMNQWKEISSLLKERNLIPFFDAAYLGFGPSVEEDTLPINYFINHHDCLIAISFSKNFGVYSERVGGLFINSLDENKIKSLSSAVKVIVRSHYSNPPSHGAITIKTIFQTSYLKKQWYSDLKNMRERLFSMRTSLYQRLSTHHHLQHLHFNFLLNQKGLFSFSGLNSFQVEQLAKEFGIYLPKNGRINMAGLNEDNIDYVVNSIAKTY